MTTREESSFFSFERDRVMNKGLACLVSLSCILCACVSKQGHTEPSLWHDAKIISRTLPAPGAGHPGNVFLEKENILIPVPETSVSWRVTDDANTVIREGKDNPACPGGLGVGWYRMEFFNAQQQSVHWTTFAVLASLPEPTPQDSPICVDSATAWFARNDPAKQERFAQLAALAGVNWIRDRMSWHELEPAKGTFATTGNYDTAAEIQHRYGLKNLQVFHRTPDWALQRELDGESAASRFPRDLRDEYSFCKAMAQRFKGMVPAWEPWNEANIPNFGGHTIDEMCSLQKAAYWGLKAGDPDVLVSWNVFAGGTSQLEGEGVLKNETWPYFETYNIHTYDPPRTYLKGFEHARTAASGRPIWLSECGIGLHFIKDSKGGELTPEQELDQARFIARSYASSLYAGVNRHFFFILGNYLENVHQFGLLRHDQTPRPGYVALAAVGRLLAGAQCLGRLAPVDKDGPYVYAFQARPDGTDREVLVIWSETPKENPLPKSLPVIAVYDYLGRPQPTTVLEKLDKAAYFIVLPKGECAKLSLEPLPALSEFKPGEPSPVVMQLEMPQIATCLNKQAHEIPAGQETDIPVHLYNFSKHAVSGKILMEELPTGWNVSVVPDVVTIPPFERIALSLKTTLPASSRESASGGWVVLRGDFGPAGKPVLAFRLVATQESLAPSVTTPVASARTSDQWKDNVSAGASGTHQPLKDGVSFTMQFGDSDPWGYPVLKLQPEEVPDASMEGLSVCLSLPKGEGDVHVQFIEDNGAMYVVRLPLKNSPQEPQRIVALFNNATWGSYSKEDPDHALQPQNIRSVMVGINAKKHSTVELAVHDMAWIKF